MDHIKVQTGDTITPCLILLILFQVLTFFLVLYTLEVTESRILHQKQFKKYKSYNRLSRNGSSRLKRKMSKECVDILVSIDVMRASRQVTSDKKEECEERREEVQTVVREPIGKSSMSRRNVTPLIFPLACDSQLRISPMITLSCACSDVCAQERVPVPLHLHYQLPASSDSGRSSQTLNRALRLLHL